MTWRAPTREERQLGVLWGVVAVSALALRPLWLEIAPLLPACPFRTLTGIPCLTCGTTHAAVALFHGRIGAALLANPLAALAGVAFIAGGLVAPLWALLGWRVPALPAPLPPWLRVGALAVLAVCWIYLIVRA